MVEKHMLSKYANLVNPEVQYVGGLFPKGRLSLVVAEGSVGKTELLLQASLSVTESRQFIPFLNNYTTADEQVMLIETENRKYDMVSRLLNLNVDLDKYYFPKGINETINFSNSADLLIIKEQLKDFKTGLIIVDSLLGLNIGLDENKEEASKALTYLAQLAEEYQVAVVCTQYLNKTVITNKIKPGNIRGHSSIPQLAQLIWAIDKQDAYVRRLYQVKNNLQNTDNSTYLYLLKDKYIDFIIPKEDETAERKTVKDVRNKIYAQYINESDKEIAVRLHRLEPDQQLNNLVNWVRRRRQKQ